MPYESIEQQRYLHAKKPRLAKRWDSKYGPYRHRSKKRKYDKKAIQSAMKGR